MSIYEWVNYFDDARFLKIKLKNIAGDTLFFGFLDDMPIDLRLKNIKSVFNLTKTFGMDYLIITIYEKEYN